ncbi:hypothetical protein GU926_18335 [Nibribacter ruber]|uniref:Uncharacterized protein n=1 Tax=Nibribacter ruber TaxID=2698458 RepID=A0A6P1P4K0_9BACT|nr:hypothetical protein [Nibribacter ruber]QHL89285.1 hypothetical protein GU926_18335 [Nibribacter ruber]
MQSALKTLGTDPPVISEEATISAVPEPETPLTTTGPNDALLQEQLQFLNKVCHDIAKITQAIHM